jgi:hypothetical protein
LLSNDLVFNIYLFKGEKEKKLRMKNQGAVPSVKGGRSLQHREREATPTVLSAPP